MQTAVANNGPQLQNLGGRLVTDYRIGGGPALSYLNTGTQGQPLRRPVLVRMLLPGLITECIYTVVGPP